MRSVALNCSITLNCSIIVQVALASPPAFSPSAVSSSSASPPRTALRTRAKTKRKKEKRKKETALRTHVLCNVLQHLHSRARKRSASLQTACTHRERFAAAFASSSAHTETTSSNLKEGAVGGCARLAHRRYRSGRVVMASAPHMYASMSITGGPGMRPRRHSGRPTTQPDSRFLC